MVLPRLWDITIGLAATALALVIPIGLLSDFPVAWSLTCVEWFATVVFLLDIGVHLHRRSLGSVQTVSITQAPSHRYSFSWLLVDVLAALPFYLLLGATPLQFFRLLKLSRVAQFMHQWRQRQVKYSNVLRLTFFVYWLLLSAHWITCGWVALRGAYGSVDHWTRYLDALYWCVTTLTTVGYGDVTPANNAQTLYAIGVMILGVGVYAYVIGNIATIVANLDPAKARYLQHMDRLTAFMNYRKIPPPLQRRIRDYYRYLWEKRLGSDEPAILTALPSSLHTEVALFLKRDIIESVPLFQGASDAFIREIALEMDALVFLPGDYVIRTGERGRDMYFINRGRVEVLAPDGESVYTMLSEGDFFGEISLFLNQSRSASVRALDYCDLYRLDQEMYERIQNHYPDIAKQIKVRAQERYERERSEPSERRNAHQA